MHGIQLIVYLLCRVKSCGIQQIMQIVIHSFLCYLEAIRSYILIISSTFQVSSAELNVTLESLCSYLTNGVTSGIGRVRALFVFVATYSNPQAMAGFQRPTEGNSPLKSMWEVVDSKLGLEEWFERLCGYVVYIIWHYIAIPH